MVLMPPWWSKIELKKNPLLLIKSSPVDRFWCLRCLNNRIDLSEIIGSLIGHLGLFWDRFGTNLGPFWYFFGTILGLFWDHFGKIFGPFWDNFGTILEPFCNHFWTILGPSLLWPILTYFDLWGPILTLNWVCFVPHLLLLKRGRRRPEGPKEPWEPEGPPSSLQELEGGARSSPNF